MIKEDYMKLPKERLAELLVERDLADVHMNHLIKEINKKVSDIVQNAKNKNKDSNPNTTPSLGCYSPDGICMNPFHDCINCPRQWGSGGTITTTNIE